jgi:hypothetical protein
MGCGKGAKEIQTLGEENLVRACGYKLSDLDIAKRSILEDALKAENFDSLCAKLGDIRCLPCEPPPLPPTKAENPPPAGAGTPPPAGAGTPNGVPLALVSASAITVQATKTVDFTLTAPAGYTFANARLVATLYNGEQATPDVVDVINVLVANNGSTLTGRIKATRKSNSDSDSPIGYMLLASLAQAGNQETHLGSVSFGVSKAPAGGGGGGGGGGEETPPVVPGGRDSTHQ